MKVAKTTVLSNFGQSSLSHSLFDIRRFALQRHALLCTC
jgi:hypothetical protein